jgi:hypothetical protein
MEKKKDAERTAKTEQSRAKKYTYNSCFSEPIMFMPLFLTFTLPFFTPLLLYNGLGSGGTACGPSSIMARYFHTHAKDLRSRKRYRKGKGVG